MKKFFSVKWELIIIILLSITTLISWSVLETIKDYRVMILASINLLMLIIFIIKYKTIKDFRLQVKDLW